MKSGNCWTCGTRISVWTRVPGRGPTKHDQDQRWSISS